MTLYNLVSYASEQVSEKKKNRAVYMKKYIGKFDNERKIYTFENRKTIEMIEKIKSKNREILRIRRNDYYNKCELKKELILENDKPFIIYFD